MVKNPFKICSACNFVWAERNVFLGDHGIKATGYQVDFNRLKSGLFLFKHASCHSTISIPAGEFTDLYNGEIFEMRSTGKGDCPGYCLRKNELRPCPAKCECAFVREVLQLVKNWPKA